jgi:hypothetical protein
MKSDLSNSSSQNGEYALLEYLERIGQRRQDRIAVVCHLSRLQPYNRRPHHIRIAHTTFENLLGQYEGRMFSLRNSDIIFIGHVAAKDRLNEAIIKLRYLFSTDPLITSTTDEGGGFSAWYQMDRNYDAFYDQAKRWYQSTQTGQPLDFGTRADSERVPISPDQLGWLEDALTNADLTNLIRNQPICAISANKPAVAFNEVYVSIADLETQIVPGVDLMANRWLFQYLTGILDLRMLSYLAEEGEKSTRAFSFNVNVGTLLSTEFAKFDQRVSAGLRGRLVIELQTVDVFSDMAAFMFARDYVVDRGYRLCLDGMTYSTVPFVDRAKLGFHLVKVHWNPAMKSMNFDRITDNLADSSGDAPMSRVIMTRCDNEDAVETGKAIGINLYQGRYIDRLLRDSEARSLVRTPRK